MSSSHRSEPARIIGPGDFEQERHYYPRVLNAQMHSAVTYFLGLDNRRIVARYCHINPKVNPEVLLGLLSYKPRHLAWAGADLFHATTVGGKHHMVVVETNSCPSGQKSMPFYHENEEQGGYRRLIERTFLPNLDSRRLPQGGLAVLFDKNIMECSGYAAALADCTGESVYLASCYDADPKSATRFCDGQLEVCTADGTWHPIRAAFRYVTQKPWNRIPLTSKTLIFNPIIACLAGGRNKLIAAKAYDLFNAEIADSGLKVNTPETIWDVSLHQIPLWVHRLGGLAVVKVPYSNAGQGVYTLTSPAELNAFLDRHHRYEQFVVQSLIGNFGWSSEGRGGRLYHVGTVPDKHEHIYVADLRMMVSAGTDGYRPLAIYGRRARLPLEDKLSGNIPSWDMLGTNLSLRHPDGSWGTDSQRLLLMDRKDFNTLGLGVDEILEGFIQAVLAAVAIDKMAEILTTKKSRFRSRLFASLNDDPVLLQEILQ